MQRLTERQSEVLKFIRRNVEDLGFPPTVREIAKHLGVRSTNGVHDHLTALERKGYLSREPGKSRSARLAQRPRKPVATERATTEAGDGSAVPKRVPILGRVAAGALSEAVEHADEHVLLDEKLLPANHNVFALQVEGESMINAGIQPGDTVFVDSTKQPQSGDVVVARVGDEATCKRYFPKDDHVLLQPENDAMKPIRISQREAREAVVVGVVVGLYRRI